MMTGTDFFTLLLIAFLLVIGIQLNNGAPPTWTNPEIAFHMDNTGNRIACLGVMVPIGHQFVPCHIQGGIDSFEVCPKKRYQPDTVSSKYEPICVNKWENCMSLEEIEQFQNCSLADHPCFGDGRCSITKGYCGTSCLHCQNISKHCPKERVQQDCSCSTTSSPESVVTPTKVYNASEQVAEKDISTRKNSTVEPTEQNNHFPVGTKVAVVVPCVVAAVVIAVAVVCFMRIRLERPEKDEQRTDFNAGAHKGNDESVRRSTTGNSGTERPKAEVRPLLRDEGHQNEGRRDTPVQQIQDNNNSLNHVNGNNAQSIFPSLSLSSLLADNSV